MGLEIQESLVVDDASTEGRACPRKDVERGIVARVIDDARWRADPMKEGTCIDCRGPFELV